MTYPSEANTRGADNVVNVAHPLVSICIPTYNGAATLSQTLGSIVAQSFDGLAVVICDDNSQDDTLAIAESYASRHPYICVIRNEQNLGMDRNFARTALNAKGQYVWFSGQDDIFEKGAFEKFREIVARHADVDVIYFNYRFFSGDLTQEVELPRLNLAQDAFYSSGPEYFREIDHTPTFLAATVMRRSYWDNTPYEIFFDTHYVQMGVVLHNLLDAKIFVVADPRFIVCRIPEDSWKLRGGQMLFEIFSGRLEVYHTVFESPENPIPPALYREKMRDFVRNLPIYVIMLGELGFRTNGLIEMRMKRLFGARTLLYALYIWPLIHSPLWVQNALLKMYRFPGTRWIARYSRRFLSWLAGLSKA